MTEQEINTNKELFKSFVRDCITRDGIDDLMNWLESTDFYTAPSSTRYHGAEPGGLCAHSIEVFKCLMLKRDTESVDTIAIVSLFHDLCKVNTYNLTYRNTKDEAGKWIKVPYYEIKDSYPLGHGEKSVILLMKYIKLTDEEIMAIRWHMGGYYASNPLESSQISSALSMYKLVLKLQTADQEAAFWYSK